MDDYLYGKIQGFIDSIALTKSYFEMNINYEFDFYNVDYLEDITNSIRRHIWENYSSYIQINNRNEDNVFVFKLENEFNLYELSNWREELKKGLQNWFESKFVKQNESSVYDIRGIDYVSILVDTFIGYLEDFFNNEEIQAWRLNDYFSNQLIYFWGGLYYSDYIFTFKKVIYILHLEFSD
jgi:hypothetical protein